MKKIGLMAMALWVAMGIMISCNKEEENNTVTLSALEKTDLLTLREEEKLARDVYLYAYEKYDLTVAGNISSSEQKHMDEVLSILTAYGLTDPASQDTGVFHNTQLQNVYNDLIAKVDSSMVDALLVGAFIEDLDIKDIEDFINRTDKEDVLSMYEKLVCGSHNHMRAYYQQILDNNSNYTPQFISQEEFDSIVNGDHESCGG